LVYAYAWFEDSAYLYHAFAFKSGLKPFLDTICVHPPTLEYLLAGLYNIFGVSYRVAEILSAIVVSISTILLFDISQKIFDKYIALFVTGIFSLSSLLFRYHIFEREVFTLSISVLILWIISRGRSTPYNALLIGVLVGIGFGIKFSGLFILPPVILFLLFTRQYKTILFTTLGFFVTSLIIYGYFLLSYKETAYNQLFLFHFFKGYNATITIRFLNTFVRDLNYLWIFGGGGLILSLLISNRILIFPIIIFIEYTIFFLFVSSTCWPHNMIDLLLPLSLGNGVTFHYLKLFFIESKRKIAKIFLIGVSIFVFIILGSLRQDYYQGFGYLPRNELVKAAEFVRSNTSEKMPIHAPHYLANEAQRLKIVDYEELIGPYRLIESLREKKDYTTIETLKSVHWYDLIEITLPLWRDELNNAIMERRISCAVWDKVFPEWSLIYDIDRRLEDELKLFSNAGYEIKYNSPVYTIWLAK